MCTIFETLLSLFGWDSSYEQRREGKGGVGRGVIARIYTRFVRQVENPGLLEFWDLSFKAWIP